VATEQRSDGRTDGRPAPPPPLRPCAPAPHRDGGGGVATARPAGRPALSTCLLGDPPVDVRSLLTIRYRNQTQVLLLRSDDTRVRFELFRLDIVGPLWAHFRSMSRLGHFSVQEDWCDYVSVCWRVNVCLLLVCVISLFYFTGVLSCHNRQTS